MEVNSCTRLIGLFGRPVRASLSPTLHNYAFKALKVNAVYLAFELNEEQLADAITAMKALNFLGANVTIPFKEKVVSLLDSLSPEAEAIGAVNTIKVEMGRLVGYNTDGDGFLASLKEEAGFQAAGKAALIIGAGGAARGIVASLVRARAREVWVVNRTESRAFALAKDLNRSFSGKKIFCGAVAQAAEPSFVSNFDLVVKAVPPVPLSFAFEGLKEGAVVCDLTYRPEGTDFLSQASIRGGKALNGLGMLIYQACLSFQIWTGLACPADIMEEAIKGFSNVGAGWSPVSL